MMMKFVILLAFASIGLGAHVIPDRTLISRVCVGPACPSYSLPMTVDRPGVHHSMNCSKGSVIPEDGSCRNFFLCVKNHSGVKLKCTNGYALDVKSKLCVIETRVKGCGKAFCPPSLFDGLIPDSGNCTRYFRCLHGIPIHYECEPEQIYSHEEGKCIDYEDDEVPQCVAGSGSEEVPTTTIPSTVPPPVTTVGTSPPQPQGGGEPVSSTVAPPVTTVGTSPPHAQGGGEPVSSTVPPTIPPPLAEDMIPEERPSVAALPPAEQLARMMKLRSAP